MSGWGVFVSVAQKAVHVDDLNAWALRGAEDVARGLKKTPWILVFAGDEKTARTIGKAWQERRNRGDL